MTTVDPIAQSLGLTVERLGDNPADTATVREIRFEQPAQPQPSAPAEPVQTPAEPAAPVAAAAEPAAPAPVDLKSIFGEEYGEVDKVKTLLGEVDSSDPLMLKGS